MKSEKELVDNAIAQLKIKNHKKESNKIKHLISRISNIPIKIIKVTKNKNGSITIDIGAYQDYMSEPRLTALNKALKLIGSMSAKHITAIQKDGKKVLVVPSAVELNASYAEKAVANSGYRFFFPFNNVTMSDLNLRSFLTLHKGSSFKSKTLATVGKTFEINGVHLDIMGVKDVYLDASNEGMFREQERRINEFIDKVKEKTGRSKNDILQDVIKHIENINYDITKTKNPFTKNNVKEGYERYIKIGLGLKLNVSKNIPKMIHDSFKSEKTRKDYYKKWNNQKINALRSMTVLENVVNKVTGAKNNIKTSLSTDKDGNYIWTLTTQETNPQKATFKVLNGFETINGKTEVGVVITNTKGIGSSSILEFSNREMTNARMHRFGEKRGILHAAFEKMLRENMMPEVLKDIKDDPDFSKELVGKVSAKTNNDVMVMLQEWRDKSSLSNRLFGKTYNELTDAEKLAMKNKVLYPETAEDRALRETFDNLLSDLHDASTKTSGKVTGITKKGELITLKDLFDNPNKVAKRKGYTGFKYSSLIDRIKEYELIREAESSPFYRIYRYMSQFDELAYALREESNRAVDMRMRILKDEKINVNGREMTIQEALTEVGGQLTEEIYDGLQESMANFLSTNNIDNASLNVLSKDFPMYFGINKFMNLKDAIDLHKIFSKASTKEYVPPPDPSNPSIVTHVYNTLHQFNAEGRSYNQLELFGKTSKNEVEESANNYLNTLNKLKEVIENNIGKLDLKEYPEEADIHSDRYMLDKNLNHLVSEASKRIPNIINPNKDFASTWKSHQEELNTLLKGKLPKNVESALESTKSALNTMLDVGSHEEHVRFIETLKMSSDAHKIIDGIESMMISYTGNRSEAPIYVNDGFNSFLSLLGKNPALTDINERGRIIISNKLIELLTSLREGTEFSAFEVMTGRKPGIVPSGESELMADNLGNLENGNIIRDVFGNQYIFIENKSYPITNIKYATGDVLNRLNRSNLTPVHNTHNQSPGETIIYGKDKIIKTKMGFIVLDEFKNEKNVVPFVKGGKASAKDMLSWFFGESTLPSKELNMTTEASQYFSNIFNSVLPISERARESFGYRVDMETRARANMLKGSEKIIHELEDIMKKKFGRDGSADRNDIAVVQSIESPDKVKKNLYDADWDAYNFMNIGSKLGGTKIWATSPKEVKDYIQYTIDNWESNFTNVLDASRYLKRFTEVWIKHAVVEGRRYKDSKSVRHFNQKFLKSVFLPTLKAPKLEGYLDVIDRVETLLKDEDVYVLLQDIKKWKGKAKGYSKKGKDLIYEKLMKKASTVSLKNLSTKEELEEYLSILKTKKSDDLDVVKDYLLVKETEKLVEDILSYEKDDGTTTDDANIEDDVVDLDASMKEAVKLAKNINFENHIYDRKRAFFTDYLNMSELVFDDIIPDNIKKEYISNLTQIAQGRLSQSMFDLMVNVKYLHIENTLNKELDSRRIEKFEKSLDMGTLGILFNHPLFNRTPSYAFTVNHIGMYFGGKGFTTRNAFHEALLNPLLDNDVKVLSSMSKIYERLRDVDLPQKNRLATGIVGILTEKIPQKIDKKTVENLIELYEEGMSDHLFKDLLAGRKDVKLALTEAISVIGEKGTTLTPYETDLQRKALYEILNNFQLELKKDMIRISLGEETPTISKKEVEEKLNDSFYQGANRDIRTYRQKMKKWLSDNNYETLNEFLEDVTVKGKDVLSNNEKIFLSEARGVSKDVASGMYTDGLGVAEMAALRGVGTTFHEDYFPLLVFKTEFDNMVERKLELEGETKNEWVLPKQVYDNTFRGVHKNKSISTAKDFLKNRTGNTNIIELDPLKSIPRRLRGEIFFTQNEFQRAIIQKFINTSELLNGDKGNANTKLLITELLTNYYNNGMTKIRKKTSEAVLRQKKSPAAVLNSMTGKDFTFRGPSPSKIIHNVITGIRGSVLGKFFRSIGQGTAHLGTIGTTEETNPALDVKDTVKGGLMMIKRYTDNQVSDFLKEYAPQVYYRAFLEYDNLGGDINRQVSKFKRSVKNQEYDENSSLLKRVFSYVEKSELGTRMNEDFSVRDLYDIDKAVRLQLYLLLQVDKITALTSFFTNMYDLHKVKGTEFDITKPDLEIIREATMKTHGMHGGDSPLWKSGATMGAEAVYKVEGGALMDIVTTSLTAFTQFVQTAFSSNYIHSSYNWEKAKQSKDHKEKGEALYKMFKSNIGYLLAIVLFRYWVDKMYKKKLEEEYKRINVTDAEEKINKRYGHTAVWVRSMFDYTFPVTGAGYLLASLIESGLKSTGDFAEDWELPGKPYAPELITQAVHTDMMRSFNTLLEGHPEGRTEVLRDLKRETLRIRKHEFDYAHPKHLGWVEQQLAVQDLLMMSGVFIPVWMSEYRETLLTIKRSIKDKGWNESITPLPSTKTKSIIKKR